MFRPVTFINSLERIEKEGSEMCNVFTKVNIVVKKKNSLR